MSEPIASVTSIFSGVDQEAMLDRLAESPLEDAEVGFLTDRDATGKREVSQSLLAGIRIFAGDRPDPDERPEPPAATLEIPEPGGSVAESEGFRAAFILFGPGDHTASSA